MGSQEGAEDRSSRRAFLKTGGAGALTLALAGCDGLPDEEDDDGGDGTGNETDGGADTTNTGGDGGTDDPLVADVTHVNTEFAADESNLVQATFAEEGYTRIEGLPGLDTSEEATPVGHAATYGHEMHLPEDLSGDEAVPTGQPFLRVLSAGMLSLPAMEEEAGPGNPYAEAPLSELVAAREDNLLLAAAGLGTTVEWLSDPVSVEQTEADFLDGTATVETFVGPVRAEPGPGMPSGADAGFLDDGATSPGSYMATVHVARGYVGGDVVMTGMVGGWRRPPTMDPPVDDIGADMSDLLSDVYKDVVRTAMFLGVLSEAERTAAALMPDEEDRPPGHDKESRRETISTWYGLDEGGQVELGYPTESVTSETVFEVITYGRDAPSMFSGEAFDPEVHSRGTKIYLTIETNGLVYPMDDDVEVGFGVLASPLVEINGEERNPLAADPLSGSMDGFEGLWDLFRWVTDSGDLGWNSGPSEFDQLSNLELLGRTTSATGFDGEVVRAVDGTRESDPVSFYISRVTSGDLVLLGVAFTFEDGDGFFADSEAPAKLIERGLEEVVYDPDTPNEWVDGSLDDVNLVQICRNTRLETGSGDVLGQPDPDLVEGRYTAAPFDVSTFSGSVHADKRLRYGVFTLDAATRATPIGETLLHRPDLRALDQGISDPDVLFDGNRANDNDPINDLPVFELQDSDDAVTVEFQAPSGYSYDATTLQEGSDYSTTGLDFLRVGFITVSDPEDGANYGDGDGGPVNYETTVEAAFEYLKRTFPTGVSAYRHDAAIEGVKFADGNASENETKDYRNARVALERIAKPGNNNWSWSGTTMAHRTTASNAKSAIRQNGFDVWVLVPPNEYYKFHRDGRPSGLAPGADDLAVTAIEGDRNGRARAAETVAQEIGHRLADDQYRNPTSANNTGFPLAQRDDEGVDVGPAGGIDYDHARHLDSNNDGDTPTDGPGVVSRAYSLAEGEFVVPTHTEWTSDYSLSDVTNDPVRFGSYGPNGDTARLGRMESYMSYSGRSVWADSRITQDVIDSGLNRDSGNFRTRQVVFGGLNEVSADAAGGDSAEDPSPSVSDFEVAEATVSESADDHPDHEDVVEVAMHDPDGERLAVTAVAARTAVDGDGVEDGALAGDATFAIEFPPEAVEMTVAAETGSLSVNPVTRAIREAYDRLPPEGYQGDPEPVRGRIDALVENVDGEMAAGAYGAARDLLESFAETELANTVNPEFEPLANQYDEARLRSLFAEMTERLDGLASGDPTDDEPQVGEAPPWTDWVPEPAALPGFAESRGFLQFDVASALGSNGIVEKAQLEDPMANPFFGGLFADILADELAAVGLAEAVLGPAAVEDDPDPADVPAETVVLVGNVQLFLGNFDTDRIEAAVEENEFEETATAGVYANAASDLLFAYGDGYVVAAETVDEVSTALATGTGDRSAWHEVESEVEWLYGAGAGGDFTLVNHYSEGTITETGDGADLSPFFDANGVAQSASLDGETFTDATAAVVYPSEDAVELSALRETLGLDAVDRSFAQDGRFVQVQATYGG